MGDVTVDSSICLQSGIVQNKLMWKWLKLSNIQQCWDNKVMLHKTLMRLIIPVKFFCGHFMASDPGVWNLLQYCMIMIWMVRFYVDSVLKMLEVTAFKSTNQRQIHFFYAPGPPQNRLEWHNFTIYIKFLKGAVALTKSCSDFDAYNGWSFHLYCHV